MQKIVNSRNHSLVLEPYQVIPLRIRVDLGAMAVKGYSGFPNGSALEEPQTMYKVWLVGWLDFMVYQP